MRLTTKGRFAVTAMIDLALREAHGPATLAGISHRGNGGIKKDKRLIYIESLASAPNANSLILAI